MEYEFQPVIVVVAFNRLKSLKRILDSLDKAIYRNPVRLVISIDNNGKNTDVKDAADTFIWKHGDKEVLYRNGHLGLRKHVLTCGDLVYNYGSIIMLEDDLVVSPFFYKYTLGALQFYGKDPAIAGLSLYNLPYAEAWKLPFIPILDDSDVYFKQVPSSLGQVWTRDQWDSFRKWYDQGHNTDLIKKLPWIVKQYWTETSWKKYFYGYIIEENKYFVYPQISFTTNFNDQGANMMVKSHYGQVRLEISDRQYKFKSLQDAINVYDAYSEILPDRLQKLNPELSSYDFDVDLYGIKDYFLKPFVLTSKNVSNPVLGFERTMKPIEMNVVYNIPGNDLVLARREDVSLKPASIEKFISEFTYFYRNVFDTDVLLKILFSRAKNKIKSFLGTKSK
jgi:hypothetical protein